MYEQKEELKELQKEEHKDEHKSMPNSDEVQNNHDDDINVLSGDNKIDVGIKPDVKSNDVYLQLCSCSLVFNCFASNSTAKNSD
jgi:hypothetical protein